MSLNRAAVAGGIIAVALGVAGLVRGAVPQSVAVAASTPGAVTVTNAYVRAPVPPTRVAAAYFTVYNTTDRSDELQSVQTGAGGTAVLHAVVGGVMSAAANGVAIPAHGRLVLSTGRGHVMIGDLFGRVAAGQYVDMTVQFRDAGIVEVTAPVIAVGAAPPGSSASDTSEPGQSSTPNTPSGAHS